MTREQRLERLLVQLTQLIEAVRVSPSTLDLEPLASRWARLRRDVREELSKRGAPN